MFRIRRIYDETRQVDKASIGQVLDIMRSHFSTLSERKINEVYEQLRNPFKYKFRAVLFVAERRSGNVTGFALMTHAPDLDFCFLDFIASRKDIMSRTIYFI